MYLSAYGQIVAEEWNKSFEIRTELFCDAFVIMPNHIHAILRIKYSAAVAVETYSCASLRDDEPHGRAVLQDNDNITQPHNCVYLRDDDNNRASIRGARDGYGVAFREPKSISSFVGGFKSVVTARINTLRQTKGQKVWQCRFHDHVIRDYEACRRIGAYIDSNIANWKDDMYYKP
jgi:putative transposase